MSDFEFDFSRATLGDMTEFLSLADEIRSEETFTKLFGEFGKFQVRSDLALRTFAIVKKFSVEPLDENEIIDHPELVSSFSQGFTQMLIDHGWGPKESS